MLIFIGLVLLVIYLVGFIKGGWFKNTSKEIKEFSELHESGGMADMSETEQAKIGLKMVAKALGNLAFSITTMFLLICFFIGALSVDTLLIPTVFMLAYFIYGIVRPIVSESYREKIKKKDLSVTSSKAQFKRGLMLVYILYILILLIV